ncbi:hypothetical protein J7399_08850 [Shimia sp. R9_1]|uniref:PaaX family transcriptional regulator C-terminal domain-containing protein n=1 Tax=Shimia sp. R9_1 TaxID=2821111 RepID=UPI001ADD257D|nr:PaaX family transcriptional regulator C-terminal domain-containing protein [Shimia sp. R9_1]MBO9407533.1 hypothetical protein [Shimia sp. R9_1]
MQQVDLQEDIKAVRDCGPIKVWSVVVTILGDLLQDEESWVSGPVLDALVRPLGINNQALRVALHRLRRDGWVITEKRGRMSAHRLSAEGWAATERARPQVYGAKGNAAATVSLLIGEPSLTVAEFEALLPAGAVPLSTRSALVSGLSETPQGCLLSAFAPSDMPEWVTETVAPQVMRAEYDELASVVERVLAHPVPEDLFDRTSLRLVVLHHWRRLCLRHGAVQDLVLPRDWEGARARQMVLRAFQHLPRPKIDALEQRVPLR